MPVAADDVRTFESVVGAEDSPEEVQDNRDYFREQGLDAQPIDEKGKVVTEEKPKEVEVTAVESVEEVDDDKDEPEGQTAAVHDGEKQGKLGQRARKTKELNELKARLASTTTESERQIAELRRQLAEKDKTSPATTSAGSGMSATAPTVVKEETKPVEAPKAKEFEKSRPVPPKFADFASADDPIASHADAVAEHADKLSDWKDEKRAFDAQQQTLVQEQTRKQEHAKTAQEEQAREVREKLDQAIQAHPDWRETTQGKFTPVLDYVLSQAVPNGLEIAYQLARPENAAILAELKQSSQHAEGESQRSIERRIANAIYDIAQKVPQLKVADAKGKTEVETEPESEEEEVPPAKPKQTPPKVTLQRREEATPAPTRSRGAAATRLEDIPPENYDERRKWREAHGEL